MKLQFDFVACGLVLNARAFVRCKHKHFKQLSSICCCCRGRRHLNVFRWFSIQFQRKFSANCQTTNSSENQQTHTYTERESGRQQTLTSQVHIHIVLLLFSCYKCGVQITIEYRQHLTQTRTHSDTFIHTHKHIVFGSSFVL